jgi:hypothetical protein
MRLTLKDVYAKGRLGEAQDLGVFVEPISQVYVRICFNHSF